MRSRLRTAFCLGLVLVTWLGSAPAAEAQARRRDHAPGLHAAARKPPASLRRWLEGLPPLQRRAAVQRIRRMNPVARQRFFRNWERMPDAERRHLQERMERRIRRALRAAEQGQHARQGKRDELRRRVEQMSPPERRAFRRQLNEWRQLGPEGKSRMRGRLEVFRSLTADQQSALIEKQFPEKTEEERARILAQLRAASTALLPPTADRD